jgi:hypothetical protein
VIQQRSAGRLLGVDETTESVSEKQEPRVSSLCAQRTRSHRSIVLEASDVVATASLMLTVGVLDRRTAKPTHKTSAPYSSGMRV